MRIAVRFGGRDGRRRFMLCKWREGSIIDMSMNGQNGLDDDIQTFNLGGGDDSEGKDQIRSGQSGFGARK